MQTAWQAAVHLAQAGITGVDDRDESQIALFVNFCYVAPGISQTQRIPCGCDLAVFDGQVSRIRGAALKVFQRSSYTEHAIRKYSQHKITGISRSYPGPFNLRDLGYPRTRRFYCWGGILFYHLWLGLVCCRGFYLRNQRWFFSTTSGKSQA